MIVGVDFGSGPSEVVMAIMINGRIVLDDLPWAEVATDQDRTTFLDAVESEYGIELSDGDRESIQTVGDLTTLVARRVNV